MVKHSALSLFAEVAAVVLRELLKKADLNPKHWSVHVSFCVHR